MHVWWGGGGGLGRQVWRRVPYGVSSSALHGDRASACTHLVVGPPTWACACTHLVVGPPTWACACTYLVVGPPTWACACTHLVVGPSSWAFRVSCFRLLLSECYVSTLVCASCLAHPPPPCYNTRSCPCLSPSAR